MAEKIKMKTISSDLFLVHMSFPFSTGKKSAEEMLLGYFECYKCDDLEVKCISHKEYRFYQYELDL